MHCPIRFGRLRAAGLVALALLAIAPLLFSAEPTPAKFTVPVVIGGQTYQGDATVDADGSIRVTIVLVYRVQPGPIPDPGPKPKPDPPTPIVKPTKVILLAETKNAPVKIAAVATSKVWKDEAAKLGMKWSVSDPDPIAETYPVLVGKAKAKGLPAFVFLDDAMQILAIEKCPDSIESATALIRKMGGAK